MRRLLLFFLTLLLITACEVYIDFDGQIEQESKISINAIAIAGEPFYVYVNKSLIFNSVGDVALKDATVVINVNSRDSYSLSFSEELGYYIVDNTEYSPSIGDIISISISHPDFETISATTQVLEKVDYEILEHTTVYSENPILDNMPITMPIDAYGIDSVMNIVCLLKDNPKSKDFYRLNVRSIGRDLPLTSVNDEKPFCATDLFVSKDPIFFDYNITKSLDGRPVNFSTVFDDKIFNGKDYSFVVEIRKRITKYSWVEFDFQKITEDTYKYLKFVEKFRCSQNDVFAEPLQSFSNINQGYGILGSLTQNKIIINF